MQPKQWYLVIGVILIVVLSSCEKQISYQRHVNSILQSKCLSCHNGSGEGSEKSGFNVTSYEALMKGTKFGAVIIPGDSNASTLYRLIDHKVDPKIQMPPHHDDSFASKNLEPLSALQIETIKTWIDQGAKNN